MTGRLSAQAAPRPAVAFATIAGRVVGPDDTPIVGATVRALVDADGSVGVSSATTDAAGHFALRRVPTGVVRIEVRRLGFAPRTVRGVDVDDRLPAALRIDLSPTAAVLSAVTAHSGSFTPATGASTPVSAASLSTGEIRRAPGAGEDAVRAVSVLAGVAPTTEARNDLVVRGGAAFENLFVIDGVEVPNINHFGAQGSTGGGVSIVPADFIREATLATGGFGARWGDRASSVVDLALRDGIRERVTGTLNIAASGAGASIEGPLGGATTGGSFLAGVRRSYLDPLFRALRYRIVPTFEDATARTAFRPSARDAVSAFAIVGCSSVQADAATPDAQWRNRDVVAPHEVQYATGLTWHHQFDASGPLRDAAVTTTFGRTGTHFRTAQQDVGADRAPALLLRANTEEADMQLRTEISWTRHDGARLEVGNVAHYADRLRYDLRLAAGLRRDAAGAPHALAIDTGMTAFRDAAYAQLTLPLTPRVRLTAGGRADHYAFLGGATRFAPRGSVVWAPDDRNAVTLAAGRYWQAPQTIWLVGDPANAPTTAGAGLRPLRADHLIARYARTPRPDLQMRVEAYVKAYGDYPSRVWRPRAVLQPGAFDDALTDIPFGLEPLVSAGRGRVTGVEVVAEKKPSAVPFYVLAALSASRARFRSLEGGLTPGAFDVPLIATLVGGWRPGAGWEVSGRGRLASGAPTTPFVRDSALGGVPDFARYAEGPRRERFFQLDARVNRDFSLRRGRHVSAYVDVLDLTGRRNAYAEEWSFDRHSPMALRTIGRLPTVGLNWVM